MQKYLFFIWLLFYSLVGHTQVIDTLCVGTIRNYEVHGDSGSIYNWHINGGIVISNSTKDSIIVQWGNIGGIYQIYVIETNINGCFGDTIFANVLVSPLPGTISISGPDEICNGDTITLTAVNTFDFIWNTGSTNQSITVHPSFSTLYSVINFTKCGTDTAFHSLTVHQNPIPNFIFNPYPVNIGDNINLFYTGSLVNSYNWFENDLNYLFSNQPNTNYIIQNKDSTNFRLYVTDQFGCSDSITKTVFNNEKVNIWVPTSFSPNGDGINDIFNIESGMEVLNFSFYIYNRWGQLVFESNDVNKGWDGKYQGEKAPIDVYNWVLTYQPISNNQKILNRKTGQITLIR